MSTNNEQWNESKDPDPKDLSKKPITNQEAAEFENPSTDPGFEPSYIEEEPPQEEDQDKADDLLDDEDEKNKII